MTPTEYDDALMALNEYGARYLLGWLSGTIITEGQATEATLAAALPLAQRWGERWEVLERKRCGCDACNAVHESDAAEPLDVARAYLGESA